MPPDILLVAKKGRSFKRSELVHLRTKCVYIDSDQLSTSWRKYLARTLALLAGRVPEEARFAGLALRALCVVETLEALSGGRVAAALHVRVDVVVADAGLAGSARHERAPEVVHRALVAALT